MFDTKTVSSVIVLLLGILLLSVVVSFLTVVFYGPSTREPTTVVIERPWNNYRSWWGYYGAGLPGWGGHRFPPSPPPHPKPAPPSPPATPPPASPPPANPPPANPPPASP